MGLSIIQVENRSAQVVGYYNGYTYVLLQFIDAEVPEHLKIFGKGSPFGMIRADEIGLAPKRASQQLPLFGG